jgi:hypothetical protein
MARNEELAARFATQLAEIFSEEVYGEEGPKLDCDIDEFEDLAVLAARAAFDAVLARALVLQNTKLPSQIQCPKCGKDCDVTFQERTIRGRLGLSKIQEPVCNCSVCDRAFFPSAGIPAAR